MDTLPVNGHFLSMYVPSIAYKCTNPIYKCESIKTKGKENTNIIIQIHERKNIEKPLTYPYLKLVKYITNRTAIKAVLCKRSL